MTPRQIQFCVYHTLSIRNRDFKLSGANHKDKKYQARVLEDCQLLEEELGYHKQEEVDSNDNWKGSDEEDITIITLAALKGLWSSTLTPLNEYDTVQIRNVQQFIVNGLMRVTCEIHDHGHVFILETQDYFWLHTGEPLVVLPKASKWPDKELAVTNYKKFYQELKLYNTYMETECATIELLKEVLPNSFVGLEITYR